MKKRILSVLALLLLASLPAFGQATGLAQQFTVNVAPAPPAVLVGQNGSTSTATGAAVSATGGSIVAGSYRVGVTCFSSSNTETPLSTDTATSAVAVLTGSTSTLTIYPPICTGTGNEVGWRPYVGASGGASGAEALVTPAATICTLSTSSTPSCALTSPAVFVSTTFASGGGGPASPGTLIFPPVTNAANQALFENSTQLAHIINWVTTGTVPTACTFQLQTGAATGSLANVGQVTTCTAATGSYAVPYVTANAYSSINLATFTPGSTTSSTTFWMTTLPYVNPIYWGNAAPTSACAAPMGVYFLTGANSNMYTCVTTTWTAITLP